MSFMKHFENLPDPRSHINRRHDLLDIMFLCVAATLSGAEGWKDIKTFGDSKLGWLRKFRGFEAGIPVDDTIARVVSSLNPQRFLKYFVSWVNEIRDEQGHEHIAIDGKTLRRSFHKGRRNDALHMLSVWVSGADLFFSGAKSKAKKNEVETVLELIEMLEVKGTVITLDAMSTQRAVAEKIKQKQGDYILALKGNQGKLHKEVKAYFHKCHRDNELGEDPHYREVEKGHGRIEERHYTQLPVSAWIEQSRHWSGLQSVIEVTRVRHIDDKTSSETQYYISSLAVDVKACAKHIRQHWGVENKVHWVLDMTFREDESRIRRGEGAEIVAMIRRFCLNLARLNSTKDSVRSKLKRVSWNDDFREAILFS